MVTAPCGVHEAPQLCSWLDSAPPWEAGTSAQPQLGDAISPSPPLPTPAGQMSPSPRPAVLQGYKTSAANMVGNSLGFPCWHTADPSGNLLHRSGSPQRPRT